MEKLTAELRVTSLKVQPFAYKDGKGEMVGGESMELRASGFWVDDSGPAGEPSNYFPMSLHVSVYPGHGIVPVIGDCVTVSVERR